MADAETKMGGSGHSFPQTNWSSILSISDPDSPERRDRLNRLLQQYWRPVYKFIRASWGRSNEDSKDLAQAFFTHILETDLFSRYDKEKGRFRHFLKGALRNFLNKEYRTAKTQKRGGDRTALSLDWRDDDEAEFQVEAKQYQPEELFDRQWAREVMIVALERLRVVLRDEGKEKYFQVFEAYTMNPDRSPTYEEIGRNLDLNVRTVENYLRAARARLHDLMLEQISDYVTSPKEVMDEMRDLFRE